MMNKRFCTAILALLTLGTALRGQQKQDYSFMLQTNPRLTLGNPAFLDSFSGKQTALANVDFVKTDGGLCSISESSNSFEALAGAQAFARISDRIAFYGKLSYSYFNGKNMGGPVFMNPEDNPINFLESTDTTAGVKIRELYSLSGGMTYRFSDRLSAGIRVDYTSGDQTKTRDPRFMNYWMDLNLGAGLGWAVSDRWDMGLVLRYRNTMESIQGHIYGTTDKQYTIYTDKGGFWGTAEGLDGDYSYLPTSVYRPMTNNYYGGSIQFSYVSGVKLFNSLSFDYRTGDYGEKLSSKPIFFEFGGFTAGYSGVLQIPLADNMHQIGLDVKYSPLSNNENSFRYDTPTGKETVVVYTGQTCIMERSDISGKLSYTFFKGMSGFLPDNVSGAEFEAFYRDQNTTFYPHYRKHSYCRYRVGLKQEKSFFLPSRIFTGGLYADYCSGFGTAKEDGSYASGTTKLKSFDDWLYRQFEYETTRRFGLGFRFTYTHIFNDKVSLFVTLRDKICFTNPRLLAYLSGAWRNTAIISVGCNF